MRLDFIEKRLSLLKKNTDFAARGREIVTEKKIQLGPFPSVPYRLDWDQNPVHNRSWQWRWGTLSALGYLIAYHAQSGDRKALEIGAQLVNHWCAKFLTTEPGGTDLNEFVWHDHGTALRAEHVLWFYAHSVAIGSEESFAQNCPQAVELLEKHGSILMRNDFYSQHTNHGLEQARVLLLLGTVGAAAWKDANQWRAIALDRLRSELHFAYTEDGVHVENSPAYHIFVFKVFISIVQEFDQHDLGTLATEFMSKAKLIMNYIIHILRPDGFTPIIGDSELLRPTDSFREILGHTKEYREFLYVFTKGKSGVRPTSTYQVFPTSGYAIHRDKWAGPADFTQVTHTIFKAGPLSQYHRQQDEGHLIIYAYGEDWLIDSGMYNYNKSDPIRRYVRSRDAHNVAIVDGARYKPWEEIKNGWWLVDERPHTGEQALTFSFSGFEDLVMNRHIAFEHAFIRVRDIIRSTDGQARGVKLLWHVDAHKNIETVGTQVRVTSKLSNRCMLMDFKSDVPLNISVKCGVAGSKVYSVVSTLANKYVASQVIEIGLPAQTENDITSIISFEGT